MAKQRLQKIIAAAGITSRRHAEELITQGKVVLNGHRVTKLGAQADPAIDQIAVEGSLISAQSKIYYAFHKPVGVVTTLQDEKNRPCVGDFIKDLPTRVFPVGRLDQDSSGLLLITNDGNFSQKILHPSHEIPKSYLVSLTGRLTDQAKAKLEQGMVLKEGRTSPATIAIITQSQNETSLKITIHEGWNRQVRRMFGSLGFPVTTLQRIAIGTITLDDLPAGKLWPLTVQEIAAILKA